MRYPEQHEGNPCRGLALSLPIGILANLLLAWAVMALFHLAYWQALLIVLALGCLCVLAIALGLRHLTTRKETPDEKTTT